MDSTLQRAWAEIDLDALAHNVKTLQSRLPDAGFVGVVKADAYGHGAIQVAKTLETLNAQYLAVSNVDEARELRQGGIQLPILQLGLTPANQTGALLENHVTQAVYSLAAGEAFSREADALGKRLKAHIKLDTGMSRLGFSCGEDRFQTSLEEIAQTAALPGLEIEGIFTHFALSDEPGYHAREYTLQQCRQFDEMTQALERRGLRFRYRHCANSGAVAGYALSGYDLFRPGILTYGLGEPSAALGLKPVMTMKAVVGCVNTYRPGTAISYGGSFRTTRPSRIGVLPVGYADGLRRALSNQWRVWTKHGEAPIRGRVCMDMCMIDLTDLPGVGEGDAVELFGSHLSANEMAALIDTIPYEIVTGVSRRVPRIYLQGGKEVYRELLLR